MLADYHIHTHFSDDSTYEMEAATRKAVILGIDEICFTEHVDYGVKTDSNCNYTEYLKEYRRCNEKYKKQIVMKFGIEFGMQAHTIREFQLDFGQYDFDFVILSCHQVDNKEFWNGEFQKGKTQNEFHQVYYEEILKVIRAYDGYSVLGHLDMIKRYDTVGEYPFEKIEGIVSDILTHVISQGKGIEINTSCFRYDLKDWTPSKDILKLYRKLGGEIITIGSDTHQEEHLGYRIFQAQAILKKNGFQKFCTFEKMRPIFHDL